MSLISVNFSALSQQFRTLRQCKSFIDMKIRVPGISEEIEVISTIVGLGSRFLNESAEAERNERDGGIIEVSLPVDFVVNDDGDSLVVKLIDFLHGGDMHVSDSNIIHLLYLAEFLVVPCICEQIGMRLDKLNIDGILEHFDNFYSIFHKEGGVKISDGKSPIFVPAPLIDVLAKKVNELKDPEFGPCLDKIDEKLTKRDIESLYDRCKLQGERREEFRKKFASSVNLK